MRQTQSAVSLFFNFSLNDLVIFWALRDSAFWLKLVFIHMINGLKTFERENDG